MELVTGQHYWYRTKPEVGRPIDTWRVCYIGEDHDEKQWFHAIGIRSFEVSMLNLENMDFLPIERPFDEAKE
jgi:hypothetical protein